MKLHANQSAQVLIYQHTQQDKYFPKLCNYRYKVSLGLDVKNPKATSH